MTTAEERQRLIEERLSVDFAAVCSEHGVYAMGPGAFLRDLVFTAMHQIDPLLIEIEGKETD